MGRGVEGRAARAGRDVAAQAASGARQGGAGRGTWRDGTGWESSGPRRPPSSVVPPFELNKNLSQKI